jgi:hypothetical protein
VRIPGWKKGISGKTSSFRRGNILPAGKSLGGEILAGSRERYWVFYSVPSDEKLKETHAA